MYTRLSRTSYFGGVVLVAAFASSCSSGGSSSQQPKPPIPKQAPYKPSADSPPHKSISHYSNTAVTTSGNQIVTFSNLDNRTTFAASATSPNRGGLEIAVLDTYDSSRLPSLVAHDLQGQFFPRIMDIPRQYLQSSANGLSSSNITRFSLEPLSSGVPFTKNLFISQKRSVPAQFEPQLFTQTPSGLVYIGRHSFADLQRYQGVLQHASGVAVFVFPNQFTASAYSLVTTSGKLIDTAEEVIDSINTVFDTDIDKNKKHHIYVPTPFYARKVLFGQTPLAIASLVSRTNNDVHIKDLYPIQPGNTWTYTPNVGAPFQVKAQMGTALDKTFIAVTEPEGTSFIGFNNDVLHHFGFRSQGTTVMFRTPLVLGNNSMFDQRRFETTSEVLVKDHPEITGTITTSYTVTSRGNHVITSNNLSFGDCFAVREQTFMDTINTQTKERITKVFDTTRYLAKNVGPVQITSGNYTADLTNVYHNSTSNLENKLSNQPAPITNPRTTKGKIAAIINKIKSH